jgi:CheY-like chemotaxis protein
MRWPKATARARHAGTIVLGTHGRSGVARFVLGSVANRVVAQARCPVLTVRGGSAGMDLDRGGPRLILVVEDEADLAATCARLLRRCGHAVVTVGSRKAGLAALSEPPALLVSDVRLPDGDGLDIVRAATAMRPRVPAVVMSARASEVDRVAAQAAGALGFLSKPFSAEAFAGVVDRLLADGATG